MGGHHHELIGYIGCGDEQKVIGGIVAICEQEGLKRIELARIPHYYFQGRANLSWEKRK